MAEDLEVTVLTADVLDWLASTGLMLRPDVGDAAIAYAPALEDDLALEPRPANTYNPVPRRSVEGTVEAVGGAGRERCGPAERRVRQASVRPTWATSGRASLGSAGRE